MTATAPFKPATVSPSSYRWSVAEYDRLGELGFFQNQRVKLIRGEIIPMSPVNWNHVLVKLATSEELRRVFDGIGWLNEQSPLPMILSDSEPEPNVMIVAGKFQDYRNHPTQPLLVVEISDSSLNYDLTVKCELYAEAKIQQYWVIDVNARCVHVFREPVELAPGGHSYRIQTIHGDGDFLEPLNGGQKIQVMNLFPEAR